MAFLVLPGAVATISSGPDALTTGTLAETLDGAFSQWWSTGETNLTPDMQSIVSFWEVFHVGKLVISAGLLTVLLLAGARLLQAYSGSERRGRRAGIAIIGALGAFWVALLLLVVLANIQGAMSPLSSVMGLLPMGVPSEAVLEVRTHFANGTTTPILGILIEDFRNYHAVMVGCSAIAAIAVAGAAIVVWIRRAQVSRENVRLRRVSAILGAALTPLFLFLILILLLNMSTVDDTARALAAFFAGGGV